MLSKLLGAIVATIFAVAAQAQTNNTPKKKIENITQYNVVRPSTSTARAPIKYTAPRPNHTDLQIHVPSPVTTAPKKKTP